ncbi:MAG TPA: hypothetical protein VMF91_05535 [Bryobacteraceae bacterium]|nr:hypothetical protein [Bryobacteraceae bacterium]
MAIQVFKPGDKLPDLPGNLKEFSHPGLRSFYGFKIVADGGDYYWVPATEADFRKSEAERLGIGEMAVQPQFSCYNTGPRTCGGTCFSGFCTAVYNPTNGHYYCICEE